jgi:multidrug transporter EmrE-like cation transporter
MGVVISRTARRNIDLLTLMVLYGIASLLGAWLFMADYHALARGAPDHLGWLSLIMITCGVADAVSVVLLQRAMCSGHHGVVWTMSKSGFVLPFLASIWIFGEPAKPFKLVSLGAIVASVICFGLVNTDEAPVPAPAGAPASLRARGGRSWFVLALTALFITGLVQAFATVPSQWAGWSDRGHLRIPIYYIGVTAGYGTISFFVRRKWDFRVLPWALLVSVTALFSLVLIFKSLDSLKSVNLISLSYPVGMGVCITTFALYSLLVLREAVRPLYVVAMLLGIAGVVLGALQ